MPRIVCLSDTHNFHERIVVLDGDILIHAGDATIRGTIDETMFLTSGSPIFRTGIKFSSPEITIGFLKQTTVMLELCSTLRFTIYRILRLKSKN